MNDPALALCELFYEMGDPVDRDRRSAAGIVNAFFIHEFDIRVHGVIHPHVIPLLLAGTENVQIFSGESMFRESGNNAAVAVIVLVRSKSVEVP